MLSSLKRDVCHAVMVGLVWAAVADTLRQSDRYLALSHRGSRTTTTTWSRPERAANSSLSVPERSVLYIYYTVVRTFCLRLPQSVKRSRHCTPSWTLRPCAVEATSQPSPRRWMPQGFSQTHQRRTFALRLEYATVMLLTDPLLRLAYAALPDPPRMP